MDVNSHLHRSHVQSAAPTPLTLRRSDCEIRRTSEWTVAVVNKRATFDKRRAEASLQCDTDEGRRRRPV